MRCGGASPVVGWPSPVAADSHGPAPGYVPEPPQQVAHCPLGRQGSGKSQVQGSTNSFWSLLCAQCDPPPVLPLSHDRARNLYPQCTRKPAQRGEPSAQNAQEGLTELRLGPCCYALDGSVTATKICEKCSQDVSSPKGRGPLPSINNSFHPSL